MATNTTPKRQYQLRIRRKYIGLKQARSSIEPYLAKYNKPLSDYMRECVSLNQVNPLAPIAERVGEARESLLMEMDVLGGMLTPSDFKELCAHVRGNAKPSSAAMDYYNEMVRKNWFPTTYHKEQKEEVEAELEKLAEGQATQWDETEKKIKELVDLTKEKEDEIEECEQAIAGIYRDVERGITALEASLEQLRAKLAKAKTEDEQAEIEAAISAIEAFLASIPDTVKDGALSGITDDANSPGFETDGETLGELRERKKQCIEEIGTYTKQQEELGTEKVWVPKLHDLREEPRIGRKGSKIRVNGL